MFNGLRNAIVHHYNHLDTGRIEGMLEFVDAFFDLTVKLVRTAEKFVD